MILPVASPYEINGPHLHHEKNKPSRLSAQSCHHFNFQELIIDFFPMPDVEKHYHYD